MTEIVDQVFLPLVKPSARLRRRSGDPVLLVARLWPCAQANISPSSSGSMGMGAGR